MRGRSLVLLDKDGTLVADVPHSADPSRLRLAPGAANRLRRVLGALRIHVDHGHARALSRERLRGGASDAGSGAGDQDRLAERWHVVVLSL